MKNRRRAIKRQLRNGCSGKKRYEDPERAKRAAIALIERKRSIKHTTVYLCKRCSRYHVSRQKRKGWLILVEREYIAETSTEPPVVPERTVSQSEGHCQG